MNRRAAATDKIPLLFNNAGIGGGGSLFTNTASMGKNLQHLAGLRYLGRPNLLSAAAAEGLRGPYRQHLHVNGFWPPSAFRIAHAYSAAKFAVEGFNRSADQRSAFPTRSHQMPSV